MNSVQKMCFVLVMTSSLGTFAFAQHSRQTSRLEDPDWVRDERDKRVVYSIPGMDLVTVLQNVTYERVDETELKMDVYFPPGLRATDRRPAVIFIHGGYLPPNLLTEPKDWGEFRSFGRLMAASGFIGVTFNHRFYSDMNSLPNSQTDLFALIDYLRRHAEQFHIDPERINLWAFSGSGLLLTKVLRESPAYIRALVGYYSAFDLGSISKARPGSVEDEVLREFSPLDVVRDRGKSIPPIFIGRAGLDHPSNNEAIDRFIQLAIAGNATIDFSNNPEGHHGFDSLDDTDRSREIIKRTIEFLWAHNGR